MLVVEYRAMPGLAAALEINVGPCVSCDVSVHWLASSCPDKRLSIPRCCNLLCEPMNESCKMYLDSPMRIILESAATNRASVKNGHQYEVGSFEVVCAKSKLKSQETD